MSTARRWKRQVAARRGPALSCLAMMAEVGGRWSAEAAQFLSALAKACALSVPQGLQGWVEAAWIRRWSVILACSAALAFSLSLLDQRPVPQVCEILSAHGVLGMTSSR